MRSRCFAGRRGSSAMSTASSSGAGSPWCGVSGRGHSMSLRLRVTSGEGILVLLTEEEQTEATVRPRAGAGGLLPSRRASVSRGRRVFRSPSAALPSEDPAQPSLVDAAPGLEPHEGRSGSCQLRRTVCSLYPFWYIFCLFCLYNETPPYSMCLGWKHFSREDPTLGVSPASCHLGRGLVGSQLPRTGFLQIWRLSGHTSSPSKGSCGLGSWAH